MSIASFSLPIDIPWKRIAFSADMMDEKACDRKLPPRWRSSIAVFEYEPPMDQQRTDGSTVSYLKVSCSITGFQAEGREIGIYDKLGRSPWTWADLTNKLGDQASAYYACHGAMLEVVVAPHESDKKYGFDQYPYFADFDPKKRELYELVTDTGESMSRTLEDVNVRLGQTTLQSHEVLDKTTLGAGVSFGSGQNTASGSISNESGTTDLSQAGSENIRTVDGAREARETFSHTTQLSQMYHQLDSYHLGSNRAAFFVLPRPHTIQSPSTFVNGPREIEGIQEFMLVVVRPKEMEHFCVEAYLETAHLTGKPHLNWGNTDTPLSLTCNATGHEEFHQSASSIAQAGYIVDTSKGAQGIPLGGSFHGDTGGFDIDSVTFNGEPYQNPNDQYTGWLMKVHTATVTANAWTMIWGGRGDHPDTPGNLQLEATVYLKKITPVEDGREPGMIITGRSVCSCSRFESIAVKEKDSHYLLYESILGEPIGEAKETQGMNIVDANKIGAAIKREMISSLSSANRYPRGAVQFSDSQFFADQLAAPVQHGTGAVNPMLKDVRGIDQNVLEKIVAAAPSLTRAASLLLTLSQQMKQFGLTVEEAVNLRRQLTGITDNPIEDETQFHKQVVPLVVGLNALPAESLLSAASLRLGMATVVDSPLPTGTVIHQSLPAHSLSTKGTTVHIELASGPIVRIPDLVKSRLSDCLCALRDAGLESEPEIIGDRSPAARVLNLQPEPGSLITPKSAVVVHMQDTEGEK